MRILLLVGDVPWRPLNGFRLQVRHVAVELAKRHDVCVLGYRWPGQIEEDLPGVEVRTVPAPSLALPARARVLAQSALDGAPTSVRLYSDGMRDAFVALLASRRFDVIYCSGSNLAGLRHETGGVPMVVGALDAWHLNMRAALAFDRPARRVLRRWEEWQCRRFVAHALAETAGVVMVSEEDAAATRELDPRLSPVVIPNGVDAEMFTPSDQAPEPDHIVFTGALSYAPNVAAATWLAEEIFPRVRAEIASARLSLVGRAPHAEVLRLAERDGVEVHADVPDIRTWLWRASVYVCPMRNGTGIKNKLLEALACGRPAVVTPLACQGMEVRDEEHVLVRRDTGEMAEAVVRLLRDGPLRRRLSEAARRYVVDHHTWPGVASALEAVLAEAASATPAGAVVTR